MRVTKWIYNSLIEGVSTFVPVQSLFKWRCRQKYLFSDFREVRFC